MTSSHESSHMIQQTAEFLCKYRPISNAGKGTIFGNMFQECSLKCNQIDVVRNYCVTMYKLPLLQDTVFFLGWSVSVCISKLSSFQMYKQAISKVR